mmetsp:Transcript_29548/g.97848  ORF Transcript_29548/g.97848 Transcript_29548/m.97848 type:complete len:210 (-) Transcript_29548:1661-2290(-)
MSKTIGCALSKSSGCPFLKIGERNSRQGLCVKRAKRPSGSVMASGTSSGGGAFGVSTGGLCWGSLQRKGWLRSALSFCQSGSSRPGVAQRARTESRCTSSGLSPLTASSKPEIVRVAPSGPKLMSRASSCLNLPTTRCMLRSENRALRSNGCARSPCASSPSAGGSMNCATRPQLPSLIATPTRWSFSKSKVPFPLCKTVLALDSSDVR